MSAYALHPEAFSDLDDIREALDRAPPGVFDERS